MNEIPDGWPIDDDLSGEHGSTPGPVPGQTLVTPVFPLPGVFLFPGQVLPLHIFEPRYRAMIEDVLDGPGRIAIVSTDTQSTTADGEPGLRRVAGLGEIARHDKLDGGRFLIWLGGIARVHIDEVPSDKPYRKVRCEFTEDVQPDEAKAEALRDDLVPAIRERVSLENDVAERLPIGLLADLLAQCVKLPADQMAAIFEEPDIGTRARLALRAHRLNPPEPEGPDGQDDE